MWREADKSLDRTLRFTAEASAFLERANASGRPGRGRTGVTAEPFPRGLVRVNCTSFRSARHVPLVPRFTAAHPEVRFGHYAYDRSLDHGRAGRVAIRVRIDAPFAS